MRRKGLADQRTASTARFRGFHVTADSLPPAAAWSGYGCKPAARLTRSAGLLMTHSRHRLCTAAVSPRPFFVTAVTLLPVQKIANGLSGDPVPFSMRSGAAENRNS